MRFLYFKKFSLSLSLAVLSLSLFGQSGHFKETIHSRALRLYGNAENWNVTVKEWSKGRDTIFFHGQAKMRITTDTADTEKINGNLEFSFDWGTQFDRELIDMSGVKILYRWRGDQYMVMLRHELKYDSWVASYYSSPAGEFTDAVRFYSEGAEKRRRAEEYAELIVRENRIALVLFQKRIDGNIRMRIFDLERI